MNEAFILLLFLLLLLLFVVGAASCMKSENRTKPKANAAKLIELTKFLASKLPGAWQGRGRTKRERERVIERERGVRGCSSVGPGRAQRAALD